MTKKVDHNLKLNAIVFTVSITALVVVVWAKFLLPKSVAPADQNNAETRIIESLRGTLSGSKDTVMPLNELLEQIPESDQPADTIVQPESNAQMLEPVTSIPPKEQPVIQ